MRHVVHDVFGIEHLRKGQRPLIRAALDGRDALGILPTGAGKSLCFQVPAQLLGGTTVVVSPLLALIQDQTEHLQRDALIAVHEHLRVTDHAPSVRAVCAATELSERRVKVIVAQLDAMAVVRRERDGVVTLLRDFASAAELSQFTSAFEARFESDRGKLDEMMHYAQSTLCRVRHIFEYFGEKHESDCAHCDNCRDQPSTMLAHHAPDKPIETEHVALFRTGDRVRHRSFGEGRVDGSADEHVHVVFDSGEHKSIAPEWLASA